MPQALRKLTRTTEHEGGLRLITITRVPGSTDAQVAVTMDWMPTPLAAAGAAPHPRYQPDESDLSGALRGGGTRACRLFWRYKANHQRVMRDGDRKLLQIAGNACLFIAVADPLGRANL